MMSNQIDMYEFDLEVVEDIEAMGSPAKEFLEGFALGIGIVMIIT